MADVGVVERVWYGTGLGASLARAGLLPFERTFGALIGARDLLYDAGWLPTRPTAIPAVSLGNLTVGGTGKTPLAAWVARELATRGLRPAIVLRGYGGDEPIVHRVLNPAVPVFVAADRVAGIDRAAKAGANIAVLDDAFQHRRARRIADLVLVSADRWTREQRLLPAGPWREPLRAVRRATLIVVTRKAASDATVAEVHTALAAVAARVPRVSVRIAPGSLVRVDGVESTGSNAPELAALSLLAGAHVHLLAAIGDPAALVRQLEGVGARVTPTILRDHAEISDAALVKFVRGIPDNGWAVCTLKDAVKLEKRWPRQGPPLWYVSQQVIVERGVGGLEHLLDGLARAHVRSFPTAG
jgi:tetraacyldisaccharide 4'-kinase